MNLWKLLAFLSVIFTANVTLAHPGHIVEVIHNTSPAHYVLQPEHVWVVLIAVGIFWTLISWYNSSQQSHQDC